MLEQLSHSHRVILYTCTTDVPASYPAGVLLYPPFIGTEGLISSLAMALTTRHRRPLYMARSCRPMSVVSILVSPSNHQNTYGKYFQGPYEQDAP